ncbi:MAG: hypothetical protein ABSG03_17035 [Bryobacteraceae bacterium]
MYQMITGAIPFAAGAPLEWVHCHIARQPTAPWLIRDLMIDSDRAHHAVNVAINALDEEFSYRLSSLL